MNAALPIDTGSAASPLWILTAAGRFDLANPRGEQIEPFALARQLAQVNAWNGNTECLYSLAQRGLLVAETIALRPIARPDWSIYGLLRDLPAALVGDHQPAAKVCLVADGIDTMSIERRILNALWRALHLRQPTGEICEAVDIAHERVRATEYRDVVLGKDPLCAPRGAPLPKVIRFQKPDKVEEAFRSALDHHLREAQHG